MMSAKYEFFIEKHFSTKFAVSLVVVFSMILAFFRIALAVSPPTPYANTVESDRGWAVKTTNALGKPDESIAIIGGLGDGELVLDMGAAEEGSGDLIIYYTVTTGNVAPTLSFLDENKAVIRSVTLQSLQAGPNMAATTVIYNDPTPYRYVRFNAPFLQAFGLDAVEAISYRSDDERRE